MTQKDEKTPYAVFNAAAEKSYQALIALNEPVKFPHIIVGTTTWEKETSRQTLPGYAFFEAVKKITYGDDVLARQNDSRSQFMEFARIAMSRAVAEGLFDADTTLGIGKGSYYTPAAPSSKAA